MYPPLPIRLASPVVFGLLVLALLAAPSASLGAGPAAAKPSRPGAQTFPGDVGAIAFARIVPGGPGFRTNIFRMDADGHGVTNLTNNPTGSDGEPAWSASGTQLAFVSSRDGNDEIYRMTATGGGVTRLTNDAAEDGNPAWFPSDDRIVFESRRSGNFDLWTQDVDANGNPVGDPVQLTTSPRADSNPSVSPDGKLIAFSSDRITPQNPEGDVEIFVMKASVPEGPNNKPQQLTKNDHEDLWPDWAPNGKKLAFGSDRDAPGTGTYAVYTMTRQGKQERRLSPDGQNASQPTWSPDGKRLAYMALAAQADIYRINVDGSQLTNLTAGAGADIDSVTPAWQPR